MTPEESLEYLELIVQEQYEPSVPFTNSVKDAEMLRTLREIVEKQIPKEPILVDDIFIDDSVRVCPSCKNRGIINPLHHCLVGFDHCPACGQKLDWSNEKNETLDKSNSIV